MASGPRHPATHLPGVSATDGYTEPLSGNCSQLKGALMHNGSLTNERLMGVRKAWPPCLELRHLPRANHCSLWNWLRPLWYLYCSSTFAQSCFAGLLIHVVPKNTPHPINFLHTNLHPSFYFQGTWSKAMSLKENRVVQKLASLKGQLVFLGPKTPLPNSPVYSRK